MPKQHFNLSTARLTLKPFTATDADDTYQQITPTLTRFMSWEPPETRQDFDQIWQRWLEQIKNGEELICVIRKNENQEFLGIVGFHHVQSNTPEIGIWIREDRHGLGFGPEAVRTLVTWASKKFNIQHFIYPVAIENMASRKIAESLGGIAQYVEQQPKYKAVTYFIPSKI